MTRKYVVGAGSVKQTMPPWRGVRTAKPRSQKNKAAKTYAPPKT